MYIGINGFKAGEDKSKCAKMVSYEDSKTKTDMTKWNEQYRVRHHDAVYYLAFINASRIYEL